MLPVYSYNELFRFIMSGFVVILIDGAPRGTACGIQGYPYRSISEPTAEVNERGSKEGFTEPIRTNMSLVRRRVKSPLLKFELFPVGKISRTDICLIYMTDRVSAKLLRDVRRKINSIDLDVILTAGYLQPFLTGRPWSLFSDVGTTERPDVLAAKVQEGRIAILIDGTPFALIVPYLFTENFQTLDDYAHSAFYASFIRIIRYFSFIISILLPGAYVAISTFHPELLPQALLFNIAAAEDTTPFPLGIEALIIHLLYEIMREAGLRLPRPVGHAVSIVGALGHRRRCRYRRADRRADDYDCRHHGDRLICGAVLVRAGFRPSLRLYSCRYDARPLRYHIAEPAAAYKHLYAPEFRTALYRAGLRPFLPEPCAIRLSV